ncbi:MULTISPECIES: DUF1127 domain-containing protein [unclassified Marinobacter]|uniref:DUF1127 domain-containing protein n=1 Tax=unclassified Marinobacter TaxID=83889 RepID=UPI00192682F0|nr:DUF1127 domain-containing protein [Marinobacter sp. MC3]MBL3895702.1 DUF1127 domain-containing protein [Marinobacter sp. MW3]
MPKAQTSRKDSLLVHLLKKWHTRRRNQNELESSSDFLLKDIGISSPTLRHDYRERIWRY